jgi:F0F1-type ATP synthase assembly protein I
MMVTLKKYSLVIFGLFVISACRQNFEWVNINPDKLIIASKGTPAKKGVRNVSLTFDLKEKQKEIYYNSTEDYISETPAVITPEISNPKTIIKKPSKKKTAPTKLPLKSVEKVKETNNEAESVVDLSANKLNGALKIPVKPSKEIQKDSSPKEKSGPQQKKNDKVQDQLDEELLKHVQNTIQKEQEQEKSNNSYFKDLLSAKKGNSFLLTGFVLVVMGVILGLIFGKAAFLISAAGLIFALIGLYLRV